MKFSDASCRKCRREGVKLFLKGEKCLSPKCPLLRRTYAPGIFGQVPKKISEYAEQLREKQKAKRIYALSESQFKNYVKKASKSKKNTKELLLRYLETRLDNVVSKLGLAASLRQARQLISHGHFLINGKKVNIPSYQVKEKDIIKINTQAKKMAIFKDRKKSLKDVNVPSWLKLLNEEKLEGKVLHLPKREEIKTDINEVMILEFYSR